MMANQWKDSQMRGFAIWCNLKLHERGLRVESLTELHDGVTLIALIETLSGKKIEGYNPKPENKKIVKVNNVNLAFRALQDIGINVGGISASAFVDADVSSTLALVWSIIQFYQLDASAFGSGVTGTTYSAKLLNWLKQKLQSYNLPIESVKNSFKDGLCFCALVNSYHPDALDYANLNKSAAVENLQLAFSVAEKTMSIPRLMEPADLCENVVDENLIVVYVSFFVKYDPTKKKELPPPPSATTPRGQLPSTTQSQTMNLEVQPTKEKEPEKVPEKQSEPEKPKATPRPAAPVIKYPTTTLFRRRILEPTEALDTIPKYLLEREIVSADDDVFFFKRESQYKHKSWGQCGNLIKRTARALLCLEVQPGEKVCVFGKTRYEWVAFYLAALTIGAIPVSIGSSLPNKQEYANILNHSEATILLLEKQSQFKKVKNLHKSLQHVRHIITREKDSGKKAISWRQFLRLGDANAAQLDEEIKKRIANIKPDTIAALVYSPGTEGDNRNAVYYTHHNLLWTAKQICKHTNITGDDSYVSFLSMSHVVEQVMAVVVPVVSGLQVNFARDVTCLAETLKETQPSVLVAPPEYWVSCYLALKTLLPPTGIECLSEIILDQLRKSIGCGRVRVALVGGNSQPCPLEVYTFYASLGFSLVQTYGQLETTGLVTLNPAEPEKIRFNTVGKPIEGTEVKIEADGEILVKGPNVFPGYYKDEEATKRVLVDGWYHTGDVGKFDDDGYLIFDGRKSDAIKLADGQVIMPLRLETDLRAAPLIKYAFLVGEDKENPGVILMLDNIVSKKLAKKKGIQPKRLCNNTEIKEQIKQHVDTVSKAHNVKVRRCSIYPRNLSVKKGELTYTMSIRRKHINSHFATYIESLYTKEGANKAGGLDMVGEAFKKTPSMEDAKATPKKITDGCFYRKTASGEYKKTDLKQTEVEEMERQLSLAMKEIRELAKRIKTLQEQHIEDTGVIEAKETAVSLLASQVSDSEDSDGGKKRTKSGDTAVRKKKKDGKDKEKGDKEAPSKANKKSKKGGH